MREHDIKKYLSSKGINPNIIYGQNFLINDVVLEDIIDAAELKENDTVLEVGCGIGNLTERLLKKSGKVVGIEKDEQFKNILLRLKKDYKNFEIYFGDILKTNFWNDLEGEYKVVANIPYYITGKIIQLFLRAERKPSMLVLLTQKEVAENICAQPGKLGVLGVSVQLVGEPEIVRLVSRDDFFPKPEVTSAVVKVTTNKNLKLDLKEEKKFFKILHAAFLGKRKQLHNTLTNNLQLEKKFVTDSIKIIGKGEKVRPQELSLDDWLELYKIFKDRI